MRDFVFHSLLLSYTLVDKFNSRAFCCNFFFFYSLFCGFGVAPSDGRTDGQTEGCAVSAVPFHVIATCNCLCLWCSVRACLSARGAPL